MYGMYLFLFGMQVQVKAKLPYEELNKCLEYNCKTQLEYNDKFTINFITELDDAGYPDSSYRVIKALHPKVLSFVESIEDLKTLLPNNYVKKSTGYADSVRAYYYKTIDFFEMMLGFVDNNPKKYIRTEFMIDTNTTRKFLRPDNQFSATESRCILSAIENWISLGEELVIKEFRRERVAVRIVDDFPKAFAIPNRGMVLPGQKIKAEIFFGYYNETINPKFSCNYGSVKNIEEGVVEWEGQAVKPGRRIVSGNYTIKLAKTEISRGWSFQYFTGLPFINLQIDKANICYRGVANDISITVPGYDVKNIDLSINGAKANKIYDGHFEIFTQDKRRVLYAYATTDNAKGDIDTIGGIELKVKDPPLPVVRINRQNSGSILLSELQKQLSTEVVQADTDIAMFYKVVSYSVNIMKPEEKTTSGPYEITGSTFGSDVKDALLKAKSGDRIIISDVIAEDANGKRVQPAPISLLIE
jgi:hypothetical protein